MSDSLSALCKDDVAKVSVVTHEHLPPHTQELDNYFPDITDSRCQLIRKAFKTDSGSLPEELQDEFVDYINDSIAENSFESLSLTKFWSTAASSFPTVAKKCVRSLLMLPSMRRSGQAAPALCVIKNKLRSRLAIKDDMSVSLKDCTEG